MSRSKDEWEAYKEAEWDSLTEEEQAEIIAELRYYQEKPENGKK